MDLIIDDELTIPGSDLEFVTSTSGGPGGQHVNKTETKVTAQLDLEKCDALSDQQRTRIREELENRINRDGILQVTSQKHRSQSANRDEAISKMIQLISEALEQDAERKETRVPKRSKQRRIENKKQQSEKKRLRENPDPADY